MFDLKTTRDVAATLGVREWEIENALRRREIPRPAVVSGIRLWTAAEVEALRGALAARRDAGESATGRSR